MRSTIKYDNLMDTMKKCYVAGVFSFVALVICVQIVSRSRYLMSLTKLGE